MTWDGMSVTGDALRKPADGMPPEQIGELVEFPPTDNPLCRLYLAKVADAVKCDDGMYMHFFESYHLVERQARLFALVVVQGSAPIPTVLMHTVRHGGGWRLQGLLVPAAWRGQGRSTALIRGVVGQLQFEGERGLVEAAIRIRPDGQLNVPSLRAFLANGFMLTPEIHSAAIFAGDPTSAHLRGFAEPDGTYRYVLVSLAL